MTGKGLIQTAHFNVASCAHYRRVEVIVASLGTHLQPRQHGQTHKPSKPPASSKAAWLPSASRRLLYSTCYMRRCETLAPFSIVCVANREVCITNPLHAGAVSRASCCPRMRGALWEPWIEVHRSRVVGAWSGEGKRLHRSPLVPFCSARRQRGTTAAVAPHIHARLPAVERAWDDRWRVPCIETSALGSRWMRRFSSGARAGTYAHASTSGQGINLDFTTSNNAGRYHAPRRNTTKHTASQSGGVDSQPTRNHSDFPSRPCPHVTGEPGYIRRIS